MLPDQHTCGTVPTGRAKTSNKSGKKSKRAKRRKKAGSKSPGILDVVTSANAATGVTVTVATATAAIVTVVTAIAAVVTAVTVIVVTVTAVAVTAETHERLIAATWTMVASSHVLASCRTRQGSVPGASMPPDTVHE